MFTPLMFTGIGTLIVAILIFAFVAAMFCLMLIGLGLLIAFPLTLIRPLFGKKFKWDKDLFLVSLQLTPITFLLGMFGIELAKIFGDAAIELFRLSVIFRCLCLIVVAFVITVIIYFLTTIKLRKAIDNLEVRAFVAKRNCDFTRMYEYQDKCVPLKKRAELILALCSGGTAFIVILIALLMGLF